MAKNISNMKNSRIGPVSGGITQIQDKDGYWVKLDNEGKIMSKKKSAGPYKGVRKFG